MQEEKVLRWVKTLRHCATRGATAGGMVAGSGGGAAAQPLFPHWWHLRGTPTRTRLSI